MAHLTRRLLVGGGLSVLLVGTVAAPASAHVTVSSPSATQGGFGVLTFRVPTESDTASTTDVKVQFPPDQPLASVSVKPVPGWTYTVTTKKLTTPIKSDDGEVTEVVDTVEWKAAAGSPGIKPGEFNEFQVSAGPLPKVDSLTFKTIQTYSDGKEVAWIEEPTSGGSEPEHPAPTLKLAPASTGTDDGAHAAPVGDQSGTSQAADTASSDTPSKGSVTLATVLGVVGIVVGLVGVGFGATARRRPGVGGSSGSGNTTA